MKIFYKLLIVILVLALELAVLEVGMVLWLSYGPSPDVPYHHNERLAAFRASIADPSPVTAAAFQAELRLLHQHEDWKWELPLSLGIAANGIGIYYFFRSGRKVIIVTTSAVADAD